MMSAVSFVVSSLPAGFEDDHGSGLSRRSDLIALRGAGSKVISETSEGMIPKNSIVQSKLNS